MSKNKTTSKVKLSTEVILDYMEVNKDMPTLTLARMIYNENPELYKDIENVRTSVRRYRGKSGKKQLASLANKKFVETEHRPYNPFNLPDSDADPANMAPFIMPDSSKRILGLYDIHIPYHNVDAISCAIQYGLDHQVDTIVIGGDLLDFYGLSFYEKDPRKRNFWEELKLAKEFLSKLRELFPTQKMYFIVGNHEERYMRYMKVKAKELLGTTEFDLDVLLELGKFQIEYVHEKRLINVGDTTMAHGHEFGGSFFTPVSPAKTLYNKAKANMIVGHSHVDSKHREKDIHGNYITTYSIGCLCELQPDYRPYNNYVHGFVYLERRLDNTVSVNPFVINEGQII